MEKKQPKSSFRKIFVIYVEISDFTRFFDFVRIWERQKVSKDFSRSLLDQSVVKELIFYFRCCMTFWHLIWLEKWLSKISDFFSWIFVNIHSAFLTLPKIRSGKTASAGIFFSINLTHLNELELFIFLPELRRMFANAGL